jgi:hypothetical protein
MLTDVVVDTNVFLHAENEQERRQLSCQELIGLFWEAKTKLCVDEGFCFEESKNRSMIGSEYLRHLRAGSIGYALVQYLAANDRISTFSKKVPQSAMKHIRQVPDGPDRAYVRVAHNSTDKTLVSHDFNDIPPTVRERIKHAIDVSIIDSARATECLSCE